jgi:hypothetical protein
MTWQFRTSDEFLAMRRGERTDVSSLPCATPCRAPPAFAHHYPLANRTDSAGGRFCVPSRLARSASKSFTVVFGLACSTDVIFCA